MEIQTRCFTIFSKKISLEYVGSEDYPVARRTFVLLILEAAVIDGDRADRNMAYMSSRMEQLPLNVTKDERPKDFPTLTLTMKGY